MVVLWKREEDLVLPVLPVVAGSLAVLTDFMMDFYPAMAGEPGHIYSLMLLMADGRLSSGSKASFNEFDSLWGGGYFQMRLFTSAGMDAPSRVRFGVVNVANSKVVSIGLNPNGLGVNQSLPASVDHVRGAAWWMEPDLTPASPKLAQIDFALCSTGTGGTCQTVTPNLDNKKRLRKTFAGGPGTRPFVLRLTGTQVASNDFSGWCNNGSLNQSEWCYRRVYYAVLYEDTARDDVDGPCAADGFGDTGTVGCP